MTFIPETEVRLLSNVPLSNDYEHQMTFGSVADQTSYFLDKSTHNFQDFTYQREQVAVLVPKGYDSLYNCNYLMYKNSNYSNKWFYAFITRKEYVNPNNTRVFFEIDVYQTWQFDMQFKPSFVVREHRKRWNSDGSPVLHTVDEGLDYGSEYETVSVERVVPYDSVMFLVIVTKSAMHLSGGEDHTNEIMPTVNGLPQPLNYYVHPFKLNGDSPTCVVGTTNISISPILDTLKSLYTQEGAVNNVVSLYVTDYFGANVTYNAGTDTMTFGANNYEQVHVSDNVNLNMSTIRVKSLMGYTTMAKSLGNKYDGYHAVDESKLLMYPYTTLVLDDFKGNRVELKNEYIKGNDLQINYSGSLGTSNKTSYNVANYLNDTDSRVVDLERGVISNNPNDLPIITEMLSAYLQGNRNSIENQKASMMFSAVTNTAMGAIGGVVGGGGKLGVAGAVAGAGVGAMNSYYQIEGLNAKQRDIQNTPPNLVSMGGNTAYDYGNKIRGVFVIKKQITEQARRRLTDFFKMYGYKVNELKTPNLRSRQHFNYIQTIGANIQGNIPHDDLQRIKTIFNNGVTLWHTTDVGNYALSNGEV